MNNFNFKSTNFIGQRIINKCPLYECSGITSRTEWTMVALEYVIYVKYSGRIMVKQQVIF